MILAEGRIYGSGCRSGGKGCFLRGVSGELKQSDRELGKVSLTFADGRLYAVSVEGRLSLLRPPPAGFEIASQFGLPKRGDDLFLAHPVVVGGRLYIRHGRPLRIPSAPGGWHLGRSHRLRISP